MSSGLRRIEALLKGMTLRSGGAEPNLWDIPW